MAEYIKRSTVLYYLDGVATADEMAMNIARAAVKRIPAEDLAEVVRCGKCKHYHKEIGWCDIHSHFVGSEGEFCHPWESSDWKMFDEDYFCKDGERKDNG